MAQKVLYRTKSEAYEAAKRSGEPFYSSRCDCGHLSEIADVQLANTGVSGETGCFRGPYGSIFAWWED